MALTLTWPTAARGGEVEDQQPRDFEAIYAEHFRNVWRTLRRLGVSEEQLDDAAQDVFIVVDRKLPSFDGRSPRGWLYAIAVRVASDYRRGAARRATVPLCETIAAATASPARESEVNESVRLLHVLLGKLDEQKRTVFVLGELEQLSVPEIAALLGENLNTVYSRQRAARAQFDAALKRHQKRSVRQP
jgi:RNA polymerase sigma-70 factor (ECF subfamily)